ncbi:hypothetical protein [Mesorhizobium sp. M1396]|uniref:hypothetical protein n=1 Tax=Mesorhizobium sp. M1396 TaxID=2957095 RepID=UPI00333E126E
MAKTMSKDRDDVLYSFHTDCPAPSAADIIEWTKRFPQYAEDIRAHAAIARDWTAQADVDVEIDEVTLQRAHSRALNIIYRSAEADSGVPSQAVGFFELLTRAGTRISDIATEIGIARAVVADLFNGWMRPPVGGRLSRAVMHALRIDQAAFDREVLFALANPRMGEAKASGPPQVLQRSYREIVESSGMSAERIHYWLEED